MDAQKVYRLFERISEEDIILFNIDEQLCRPLDMILTSLAVPPSCIRPTVPVSHGMKNEDDLTIKIAEIVQRNQIIQKGIEDGMEPHKLIEEWYLLQCTVAQYLNADTPGLPMSMMGSKSIRALN